MALALLGTVSALHLADKEVLAGAFSLLLQDAAAVFVGDELGLDRVNIPVPRIGSSINGCNDGFIYGREETEQEQCTVLIGNGFSHASNCSCELASLLSRVLLHKLTTSNCTHKSLNRERKRREKREGW
jgi:hypothetical protein